MTAAFHHIAVASLPVAVGLLVLAAVARGALWAQLNDARIERIAAGHLGPLSTWCLTLIAVHAVALGGAGELGAGGLAVAVVIALAAVLLRAGDDAVAEEEPGDTPEWAVAARDRATPAAHPTAAAAPPSLWTEPDDHPRTGLWT
jgi:hypothetical protein